MQKILESLQKSKIIKEYIVHDFKEGDDFYYLKIIIIIINESKLILREYNSDKERNYSYHWQTKDDKLLIRWDNSPHHKDIDTFPHHKHIPDIVSSKEITLEEVLEFIEKKLNENN